MQFTRRKLLTAAGITGGLAVASGAGAVTVREVLAHGQSGPVGGTGPGAPGGPTQPPPPPDGRTLVVVTLYGGNDGLNTVIPYKDRAYHDARPELAWSGKDVLDLDGNFGFNPAYKGLHDLYKGGQVAVVHGVGYPKPDHSHFRSMDIWQTSDPEKPIHSGWLGRWLDAQGGDPLRALSFSPSLPILLTGENTAGASVIEGARKAAVPQKMAKPAPSDSPLQARAAKAFADLGTVDQKIEELPDDPDKGGQQGGAGTGTGGRGQLGKQLDMVARCIEGRVPTRVYSVSLGGFDTHADEKEDHRRLLADVDGAVSAFMERIRKVPQGNGVVVAIYSEFGRRVKANGSDGTDHGTASNMLLVGNPVKGGMHGAPPSLTDLDDGDLKFTTDFRDVYATLLSGVLGSDPTRFLFGWKGSMPALLR